MMTSTITRNGKNSLTFESVVCTQLELQRRAASFSYRRSTMCRQPSQYPLSSSFNRLSASSNRTILSTPYSSGRISTSAPLDITTQFLKTRNSNSSKRSRTSSTNSVGGVRISSVTDRQSLTSMFYWDTSSRSATSKKVSDKKQ
jgi:hypothetical protein